MRFLFLFASLLALASCGPVAPKGPVKVVFIGDPDGLTANGLRLSPAGQHLRAATAEGLVAIDPTGNVVPALAERWIVTDDGLSYIFRLRNSDWQDGEPISAVDVRKALQRNLRGLRGTSLGLDLSKIDEVSDMTSRVIEITLTSPMPDFLRLMAQPEMGVIRDSAGAGPMILVEEDANQPLLLDPVPPELRGFPAREEWQARTRQVAVTAMPAQLAVAAFSAGEADLLLNGRLATLPLADTGPLARGTVRLDAALGLFGLLIRSDEGFLADPLNRQALSMAIDRDGLLQPFNIGGWRSTDWIVPAEFSRGEFAFSDRWSELTLRQRREMATDRVSAWEDAQDEELTLRIGLPEGPGSEILFEQLEGDFGLIGVTAEKTGLRQGAELELHDRLARFYSPRWFLNQLHCGLRLGLCSEEADDLVKQAVVATDATAKAKLLAAAHRQMIDSEIFIPLGAPVRWSLVRGYVTGFEENRWGFHPLSPLSQPPT